MTSLFMILLYVGPSPDWVVGVSGLDLCRKDCTWEEYKVIDLLPYDSGTDSGISYMVSYFHNIIKILNHL